MNTMRMLATVALVGLGVAFTMYEMWWPAGVCGLLAIMCEPFTIKNKKP